MAPATARPTSPATAPTTLPTPASPPPAPAALCGLPGAPALAVAVEELAHRLLLLGPERRLGGPRHLGAAPPTCHRVRLLLLGGCVQAAVLCRHVRGLVLHEVRPVGRPQ